MEYPKFNTTKEKFDFLVKNKNSLIAQKKSTIKEADSFSYPTILKKDKEALKANNPIDASNLDVIKVMVVMNTTNIMDSHEDVHIPGIWTKTLNETKNLFHLQEHESKFSKIIAEGKNIKAYTKDFAWLELGFPFEGITQALIFESEVERKRNDFMFNQYANGYVKNHSVGMQYVRLVLCINDEDYGAEYEAWQKYFPMVANKSDAEENGYFWAITEAKLYEGSAVVRGSNYATPTLENNKTQLQLNNEPSKDTQTDLKDTQKDEPSKQEALLTNILNKL